MKLREVLRPVSYNTEIQLREYIVPRISSIHGADRYKVLFRDEFLNRYQIENCYKDLLDREVYKGISAYDDMLVIGLIADDY